MSLDTYARLRDRLRDDPPAHEPEPGQGDLIDHCTDCDSAGYLCVCDWLNAHATTTPHTELRDAA